MHLKDERTGQQAWHSANFCFLDLESILFFLPFLFLNSPALELKKPQNSSVVLALPSCCLAQCQCPLTLGHSVLYSPSPWLISWPCTAMLLLRDRRCARTRGNPSTDRERTVHTNYFPGARQLCRLTERRMPGQPCSPSQRADHSTSPEVLRTHRKQENIQEVHHYCSPTTKLPLEHLTEKQWMKMQLKLKGGNYAL